MNSLQLLNNRTAAKKGVFSPLRKSHLMALNFLAPERVNSNNKYLSENIFCGIARRNLPSLAAFHVKCLMVERFAEKNNYR
jgi:hypothetical protein